MKYRNLANLDWKPSALGFGAMRLPVIDGDQSNVDMDEAARMIRYAIDRGVNYVDTAYFYHGGNSEKAVGYALREGYRDRVKLATKFPAWEVKSSGDFDYALERQLKRLGTDKIDFYLLHGLHRPVFETLKEMGIIPWLEKKVSEGILEYLGFSFHDEYDYFETVADAYDNWTFCQVQFNYMDTEYQAGLKGVRYAAEKGLGVIVMEPLRGGQLARVPSEKISGIWDSFPVKRSPVEWALRWIWNHPEISMILSGMSTMDQVADNADIAGRAGDSHMGPDELALVEEVRKAYIESSPLPCTGCRYCMPCPNGVEIPVIFSIYSQMKMYDDSAMAKMRYNNGPWGVTPEQNASNCIECGECLERCPQHIAIPDWLKRAHGELV